MGSVVGEKFTRAAKESIAKNIPLICFSASGGARMQESLVSLFQMSKTSSVIADMRRKSVPFISVLTDPTMGGVSASLAMLGDINIAEPKALIGFAGPRVVKDTTGKAFIRLRELKNVPKDFYSISVSDYIFISYSNDKSLYYAMQSLAQLIKTEDEIKYIPKAFVQDYPKFQWRGLHLDVSRHFFSVEEIKKYLDLMVIKREYQV